MIEDVEKDELRHRIKQTPFKSLRRLLGIRLWSVDLNYSTYHPTGTVKFALSISW